jgi:AbrB family looped-hinge helix DNA binding protein
MNFHTVEVSDLAEVADGKYIFGTVKVGERGQIVIPKEARKSLEIKPGDILIVTGDKRKAIITILKANAMKHFAVDFVRATRKRHQPKKKPEEKDQWKGFRRIP